MIVNFSSNNKIIILTKMMSFQYILNKGKKLRLTAIKIQDRKREIKEIKITFNFNNNHNITDLIYIMEIIIIINLIRIIHNITIICKINITAIKVINNNNRNSNSNFSNHLFTKIIAK